MRETKSQELGKRRKARQDEHRHLYKHGTLYAHIETYLLLLVVVVAMLACFHAITNLGQSSPLSRRPPAPPQPAAVPAPRRLPLFGARKKPVVAIAIKAVPIPGPSGLQKDKQADKQPDQTTTAVYPSKRKQKSPAQTPDPYA